MDISIEHHKKKFHQIKFIMYILTIASMNIHGQSRLEIPKQLYIQNFLLTNKTNAILSKATTISLTINPITLMER